MATKKPKIVVGFVDFLEPVAQFFIENLEYDYEVIRDDDSPKYLFFGDANFGNKNLKPKFKNCIRIFYTGENQRMGDYKADFGITFDNYEDERHYRLPLYVIYDWDNRRKGTYNSINLMNIPTDRKFCSFLVKNPGCHVRNNFFFELSRYKPVASGGPLYNNIGGVIPGGDKAVENKFDFINQYKFNICFENSQHPGYTTEKLYDALVARTVPIYWGSATVALDFNPKSFLNWHDFGNFDDLIEEVIRIDNDQEEYNKMINQPMFTENVTKFMNAYKLRKWWNENLFKKTT